MKIKQEVGQKKIDGLSYVIVAPYQYQPDSPRQVEDSCIVASSSETDNSLTKLVHPVRSLSITTSISALEDRSDNFFSYLFESLKTLIFLLRLFICSFIPQ